MATLISAATITTVVGTEVSALGLNPGASPGSYLYKLDVNALAAGEVLFIREYNIISLTAANLLSAAASSFEDGTTGGWTSTINCSISNVNTHGLDGTRALQMSSTAAGNMFVNSSSATSGMAVAPGATYGGIAFFQTASLARSCRVSFQWYNVSGALVRQDDGAQVTDSVGAWTSAMVVGVAPTGAAYVILQAAVLATAGAAELHFVDCCEIGPILGVNLLTVTDSSLEGGVGSWAGISGGTQASVTSTTSAALDGTHCLTITNGASIGTSAAQTTTASPAPVVAGRTYTAVASFEAATTGRTTQLYIIWLNSSLATISTTTPTSGTDIAGSWSAISNTGTAPAGAVFAYVAVQTLSTAAAEVHYVDCIGLLDGVSTAWIIGGSQPGGWSIGGVERLNYFGSYVAGSDADPLVETVPILVDVNSRLTLQQKNGSARAIPVKALKL